jgi:hypothetical protein
MGQLMAFSRMAACELAQSDHFGAIRLPEFRAVLSLTYRRPWADAPCAARAGPPFGYRASRCLSRVFSGLPRFALLERVFSRLSRFALLERVFSGLPRFALLEPVYSGLPRFALLEPVYLSAIALRAA